MIFCFASSCLSSADGSLTHQSQMLELLQQLCKAIITRCRLTKGHA